MNSTRLKGKLIDGKYRVTHFLKAGGVGQIWLARSNADSQQVVLKLLRPDRASNETTAARFAREARLIHSVNHENICQVLDFGETKDGLSYIVMPSLLGETLGEYLKKKTLSIKKSVDIITQVLLGLGAVHRAGIVHRDLKPSNIFLERHSKGVHRVKLLDFGVSKILDDDSDKLTRTNVTIGTTYYMAPEQIDAKNVDHRADIYSIGVVLYVTLTKERPLDGDSPVEVKEKLVKSTPFIAPRCVNPDIPGALESIVFKAMARDPQKRYQTTDEMRLALGRVRLENQSEEKNDRNTSDITMDNMPTRNPWMKRGKR